jgi:hypothetical protein
MRTDAAPTSRFEMLWLPPVPSRPDLPALAADGQLCFVQDVDQVYVFHEGRWQELGPRKA